MQRLLLLTEDNFVWWMLLYYIRVDPLRGKWATNPSGFFWGVLYVVCNSGNEYLTSTMSCALDLLLWWVVTHSFKDWFDSPCFYSLFLTFSLSLYRFHDFSIATMRISYLLWFMCVCFSVFHLLILFCTSCWSYNGPVFACIHYRVVLLQHIKFVHIRFLLLT